MTDPVKFYCWTAADLMSFFRKLGFSEQAIRDARLANKRVEFHMNDMLLYIRVGGIAVLDGGGDNFSHTCPPDCPE